MITEISNFIYTVLAHVFYSRFIIIQANLYNSINDLIKVNINVISDIVDAILWFLLFIWIVFFLTLLTNNKNQKDGI